MLLMLLSCLGILRGKNFSIHLLNDGLRYFQMIGLIEGQHIHKYKITEVFSTEINCTVDSGAGCDTWGATQSATCTYDLGGEKLNSGNCFFLFFGSSLEEGACSGKNILRKLKELAKIKKTHMECLS